MQHLLDKILHTRSLISFNGVSSAAWEADICMTQNQEKADSCLWNML